MGLLFGIHALSQSSSTIVPDGRVDGSSQIQLQVLDNVRAILIGIVLHSHAIPLLLNGICPGGSDPLGAGEHDSRRLKQHTGQHSGSR